MFGEKTPRVHSYIYPGLMSMICMCMILGFGESVRAQVPPKADGEKQVIYTDAYGTTYYIRGTGPSGSDGGSPQNSVYPSPDDHELICDAPGSVGSQNTPFGDVVGGGVGMNLSVSGDLDINRVAFIFWNGNPSDPNLAAKKTGLMTLFQQVVQEVWAESVQVCGATVSLNPVFSTVNEVDSSELPAPGQVAVLQNTTVIYLDLANRSYVDPLDGITYYGAAAGNHDEAEAWAYENRGTGAFVARTQVLMSPQVASCGATSCEWENVSEAYFKRQVAQSFGYMLTLNNTWTNSTVPATNYEEPDAAMAYNNGVYPPIVKEEYIANIATRSLSCEVTAALAAEVFVERLDYSYSFSVSADWPMLVSSPWAYACEIGCAGGIAPYEWGDLNSDLGDDPLTYGEVIYYSAFLTANDAPIPFQYMPTVTFT